MTTKARIRDLQPGELVADAEALGYMFGGVPKGTIQRWAQLDGWPRRHSTTSRGRRTEYSIAAAKATFERQRVPCTPEWEPNAVQATRLGLFHWVCACGAGSLAPYVGEENARADFVQHVTRRRQKLGLLDT